jgi:hypothetical protein
LHQEANKSFHCLEVGDRKKAIPDNEEKNPHLYSVEKEYETNLAVAIRSRVTKNCTALRFQGLHDWEEGWSNLGFPPSQG